MEQKRRFRIAPLRGHEGDVVRIDLESQIKDPDQIRVRIGDVDATDVVVRSPQSVTCQVQAAEPGSRPVIILESDHEIERHDAAFEHVSGRRQHHSEADDPGNKLTVPAGGGEKPGDPTRPASNWWMLHQALEHNSYARGSRVVPLRELWATTFADALMTTQPIIGDGRLIVGICGNGPETVVALDLESGAAQWTRTGMLTSVSGTPVAVNGRVFFVETQYNVGARLVCVRIADGVEEWNQLLSASSQSGLAAAFGHIYLLTRDGKLAARRALDGALVWETSVDVGTGSTLSSPAIGFGRVFVGTAQGLRSFDAISGAPAPPTTVTPGNGNASPAIVMDVGVGNPAVVVIGDTAGRLWAYNPSTGAVVWTFDGDMPLWFTTPSVADGLLYLQQRNTLVALEPVGGSTVATSAQLGAESASAGTAAHGHAILITQNDKLVVLQRPGLSLASTLHIPAHPDGDQGHPTVEDGRLFVNTAAADPWPAANDTVRAYHKGCFIATAAHGSPLAPDVAFLCRIRDKHLRASPTGGRLLDVVENVYYRFSPAVADAMEQCPWLRAAVRLLVVTPVVRATRALVELPVRRRRARAQCAPIRDGQRGDSPQ
jgi:outer membrane protein assembly factor BamB